MISLSEILHTIAQALLIPCLIILIVLMAGAVWQIGDIVVEYIAERRKHKCDVPQLLRDVHTAGADGLADLIDELWFDGPRAEPSGRDLGSPWDKIESAGGQ